MFSAVGKIWCTPLHPPLCHHPKTRFLGTAGHLRVGPRAVLHWHISCYLPTCDNLVEGWWSGRGVAGSRPQVGSSILVAPRRCLATVAFDQAVKFLLFIRHEHIGTMGPVGRYAIADLARKGVLRRQCCWDLGLLPPYCTNAPIDFDPPRHWSAPTWARGQCCFKPKYLVSSPGVAAVLVWRS